MNLSINTSVENDTDLPDDVVAMLALTAHIKAVADFFIERGVPVEEAEKRVGQALRAAWDNSN